MVLHAQDNKTISDKVQKATQKLQLKLLLSDDQTAKVKTLVIENFNQVKENKTSVLETKITGLFNDKQKDKFSIIKKDWLLSLQTH
jgi:ribosomal protein L4